MSRKSDLYLIAEAYKSIYEQYAETPKQSVDGIVQPILDKIKADPDKSVAYQNLSKIMQQWNSTQDVKVLDELSKKIAMILGTIIPDMIENSFESIKKLWGGIAQDFKTDYNKMNARALPSYFPEDGSHSLIFQDPQEGEGEEHFSGARPRNAF